MEGTVLVTKEEFAKLKVVVDFLAQYKDKVLDTYSFSDVEFAEVDSHYHSSWLYSRNEIHATKYGCGQSDYAASCLIYFTDEQDLAIISIMVASSLSGLANLNKDANISIRNYLKMKELLEIDLDEFEALPWSNESLKDIKKRKQKELAVKLNDYVKGMDHSAINKVEPRPSRSLHSDDISIGVGALIACIVSSIAAIIWFSVS